MPEAVAPPDSGASSFWAWCHRHLVWLSLGLAFGLLVATNTTVDAFQWWLGHDAWARGGDAPRVWAIRPNDLSAGLALQPWDAWMMDRLRALSLPEWQPFQGLGSPLWANGQAAPLNPLKWLGVWGLEGPGYSFFLLSRVALAWWGMRVLGRALGWRLWVSDLSALAFVSSAPWVQGFSLPSVHVWVWMPWWLLLAWRWGQAPSARSAAAMGAFTGFMGWMGHAEVALLAAMGAFISAGCVAWWAGRLKAWGWGLPLAAPLALLVGAPMWLPFLMYVRESSAYVLDLAHSPAFEWRHNFPWRVAYKNLLLTAVNPWGGPHLSFHNANVGLAGVVAGAFAWWWAPNLRPLLAGAVALVLVGVLVFEPTTPWPLLRPSPASHYLAVWASWAMALALGGCLQHLVAHPSAWKWWGLGQALGMVLVLAQSAWVGGLAWAWAPSALGSQVGPVLSALWPAARPWAAGAQALALVSERGAWWALNVPVVARRPLPSVAALPGFPGPGPDFRLANGRPEVFQADAGTAFGLRQMDFFEAFFPRRFVAYHQLHDPRWFLVLLEAGSEAQAGPWLDLASVSHRLGGSGGAGWRLAPRPGALPRARLLVGAQASAEGLASQAELLRAEPERWRRELLVELPLGDGDRQWAARGAAVGRLRWLQDEPNALAWEVEAPQAQWLVVADQWASGWSCTLDGKPWRMHPAYLTMRAVPIPAGRHVVGMRYEAPGLRLGLLLAALGLAIALAVALWGRVRPRSLGVT